MTTPNQLATRSCTQVERLRAALHRRVKGEFKDDRARRQFRAIVAAVANWDDSTHLPFEDALAIYAFRQAIEIRRAAMSDAGLIAAVLVDGSSASKRAVWRGALALVLGPKPIATVDEVCLVGIDRAGKVRAKNAGPKLGTAWRKALAAA